MDKRRKIPAGDFRSWLTQTRTALQNNHATDVPCGTCTACCTSSYFIHIRPGDTKTLARIPRELLFPAPGLPKGHKVMGFDENGHCPMLKENKCTIYQDRPQTCRTYDCRVFWATGLPAGDDKKKLINEQVERWDFTFSKTGDKELHSAIRNTTRFLVKNRKKFPKEFIPSNTTQLAILAIKVYPLFKKNRHQGNESILIENIVKSVENE